MLSIAFLTEVSNKDSATEKGEEGCFCQQLPGCDPLASVAHFKFTTLLIQENSNQGHDTVRKREKLRAGV